MSESGVESPVIVSLSPVSSPTQNEINTTNQLMLILPDLEEIASKENVSIELQRVKEPETSIEKNLNQEPQPQPQPQPSPSTLETETETKTEPSAKLIEEKEKEQEKKAIAIVKDFKYCYEEFQKQIKSQNIVISMDTIMRMLRIAMVVVEQTNETGKNKKDFVVRMIAKIVSDCDDSTIISSEMKVEILNMLYSPLFDDTIKLVVDASKGAIDLNKVQEVASQVAVGCFSRCLAFLSKKK
jgi:hypothetical protein